MERRFVPDHHQAEAAEAEFISKVENVSIMLMQLHKRNQQKHFSFFNLLSVLFDCQSYSAAEDPETMKINFRKSTLKQQEAKDK